MKERLQKKFYEYFGYDCEAVYFSPSRINLIGEHIDYNGGMVFPCAIEIGTYGAVKKRDDGKLVLYSENLEERNEFFIDDIDKKEDRWTDYVTESGGR